MSCRRAFLSTALLAAVTVACAGAHPAPKATAGKQQKPSSVAVSAADRLVQDLGTVEDRGSPLNALDTASRHGVEAEVAALSEADRKQLRTDPKLANARPLLHLAAFGSLPVAYERLSVGTTAADELAATLLAGGDTGAAGPSSVVNQVAELAARRVVRDALVERAGDGKWSTRQLLHVADALQTLQKWDLLQRVLQQVIESTPDGETRHRLALTQVRAGDLRAARSSLELLKQSEEEIWRQRAAVTLDALSTIEQGQTASLDQRIAVARAELHLNRVERALLVLQPIQEQAATHLALAVTLIRAQLGNQLCPGFGFGLGNVALCAAAWRGTKSQERIEQLLDQAWRSGQGRDPAAVEGALGLRYVVPLLFREANAPASQTQLALAGLSKSLSEVAQNPRFKALAQFARIVERAVTRGGQSNAGERRAWRSEALSVHQQAKNEAATAATVLGLATWLAPSEDVRSLLDAIEPTTLSDPRLLGVWIRLNASSALLTGDVARLERSKALLPHWLLSSDVSEHGASLLQLAQVEVALDPRSDKKWRTVLHLAGSIGTVEAQLQGALASAALGQPVVALQQLEQLAQLEAADGQQSPFDALPRVLTLALRGLESKDGTERAARANEIQALVPNLAGTTDSAALQSWGQLWARRMKMPDTQCPELLCAAKLLGSVRPRPEPYLARMLERGVLPLGNLGLSWGYAFDRGLIPVVWVEPRWLMAL